jgi:hypothetical protein
VGWGLQLQCFGLDDPGAMSERQCANAFAGQSAFDHPGRTVVMGNRSTAADQLSGHD